ncbi:AraC family transcriptional regulator [Elizabethkingia miricola]|uniref:AraC family transcriptional regulator n=1 Tax=Elizabethkingia miricola TaxID=172045 RepID=UPI00389292A7
MAFLHQNDEFNADNRPENITGIASDMVMHDSGFHSHQKKVQLLYAPSGCMTVVTPEKQLILPPSKLLWIPAGEEHRVTFRNVVAYRSVYFSLKYVTENHLPESIQVLSVNPLLGEIIERICFWPWDMEEKEQRNILSVFKEELRTAPKESLVFSIPKDVRLQKKVEEWVLRISEPPFLNVLSGEVGAGEKTISRIFIKETGLSYQEWRLQWRLHRAVELLSEGKTVGETAFELSFSSDSAFVDFFKKQTGATPLQYMLQ